jgi:hypothetical protein
MDEATKRARYNAYMREWNARNRERVRENWRKNNSTADKRRKAADLAKEWYAENAERAKTRILARYHATKTLKGRPTGENHFAWKGEKVGYHALHVWIARELGKPSKCQHCGTTAAKRFEWANVDHKYRRVISDYIRLCTSCHRKHDYANGLSKTGGRKPKK